MFVIYVGWIQQLPPYKKIPRRICSKSGCVCSPVPKKNLQCGHVLSSLSSLTSWTSLTPLTSQQCLFEYLNCGKQHHCVWGRIWTGKYSSLFGLCLGYRVPCQKLPPKGTPRNNILIYFSIPRTFQVKRNNILRRGVVVGRIFHQNFKKNC